MGHEGGRDPPQGWLARRGEAGLAGLLARLDRQPFQSPEDGCGAGLGSQAARLLPEPFLVHLSDPEPPNLSPRAAGQPD